MELILERVFTNKTYTIGHLYYIKNKVKTYICDAIEDTDRGLKSTMSVEEIKKKKVYAQTAIPTGKYSITLKVFSNNFGKREYYKKFCKGYLPRLLNVKGFDGILIHRGIDQDSSSGCLIVGYNKIKGKVINSQQAFEKLYKILKSATDNIIINIISKY